MALPRNSVRSGGPSTATGKALASKNALKTGSYSVHAVLPGESAEDFQTLIDGLIADFTPRTTMERTLVNDIAILIWKKMRLEKASHGVIASRLSMPPTDEDFKSIFAGTAIPDGAARYLNQALEMNDGDAINARALLLLMEEWRKKSHSRNNLSVADQHHFVPLIQYLDNFEQRAKSGSASGKFVFGANTPYFDTGPDIFAESELRCLVWLLNNGNQIRAAMAKIKSGAILEAMNNATTSRASDDLNRNLYRALAELRKQQNWRTYVDVQDVERLRTIEGR